MVVNSSTTAYTSALSIAGIVRYAAGLRLHLRVDEFNRDRSRTKFAGRRDGDRVVAGAVDYDARRAVRFDSAQYGTPEASLGARLAAPRCRRA
jgi:hypothetical protein